MKTKKRKLNKTHKRHKRGGVNPFRSSNENDVNYDLKCSALLRKSLKKPPIFKFKDNDLNIGLNQVVDEELKRLIDETLIDFHAKNYAMLLDTADDTERDRLQGLLPKKPIILHNKQTVLENLICGNEKSNYVNIPPTNIPELNQIDSDALNAILIAIKNQEKKNSIRETYDIIKHDEYDL